MKLPKIERKGANLWVAILGIIAWLISFIFPEKKSLNLHKKEQNYNPVLKDAGVDTSKLIENHKYLNYLTPYIIEYNLTAIGYKKATKRTIKKIQECSFEETLVLKSDNAFRDVQLYINRCGKVTFVDNSKQVCVGIVPIEKGKKNALILIMTDSNAVIFKTIGKKSRISNKAREIFINEINKGTEGTKHSRKH